jgi:hypothetical protein
LRSATLVNGFMSRHSLNRQVQSDWALVRTDLNGLAKTYGLSWEWNRDVKQTTNSSGPSQLSDDEIGKLILRIESGGDSFRTTLTEALLLQPYDRTLGESRLNDAVRGLKKDTDQLRIQFDDRQPIIRHLERLLSQVTTIDGLLTGNLKANQPMQNDWSKLRADVAELASVFKLEVNWQPATQN